MPETRFLRRAQSFFKTPGPLRLGLAFVAGAIGMTLLTNRSLVPVGEPPLEVARLIGAVKDQLAAAEAERIKKQEMAIFELKDLKWRSTTSCAIPEEYVLR